MSSHDKILVTVKEAADMLSVSIYEVYNLVASGQLERRYIGRGARYFRIPVTSIHEYVDGLPVDPVAEAS